MPRRLRLHHGLEALPYSPPPCKINAQILRAPLNVRWRFPIAIEPGEDPGVVTGPILLVPRSAPKMINLVSG